MLAAAATAGLTAGLSLTDTIDFFTNGITDNAAIALSYALLGAYAAGLNETGLPERFVQIAVRLFGIKSSSQRDHARTRIGLLLAIARIVSLSQNVIPIHISFIPILIPPLLTLFNRLEPDRRAVACALTFGLITPYMLLPVGFSSIFHETIARNAAQNGLYIDAAMLPLAMWIPALGLLVTLGIGSSFSTIPIIVTVFVPLCLELGFSPLAIAALIGTAAALGDAGSPASDSTLGPTSGLAADGQHDHIWDTCVLTFLHYNVPLLIIGFIAAMVL